VNMTEGLYRYSPLWDTQIRLLKMIRSEDEQADIQAEILHLLMLSAQVRGYVALSYTWGMTKPSLILKIDGGTMRIRENVDWILRKLQCPCAM